MLCRCKPQSRQQFDNNLTTVWQHMFVLSNCCQTVVKLLSCLVFAKKQHLDNTPTTTRQQPDNTSARRFPAYCWSGGCPPIVGLAVCRLLLVWRLLASCIWRLTALDFRRSPAYYRCSLRFSGRPLVGMTIIGLGISAVARLLVWRLSNLIGVVARMSTSAAISVRQVCPRSTGSAAMEQSTSGTEHDNMCAICRDVMCSSTDLLHTMCCGLRQRQTRVG